MRQEASVLDFIKERIRGILLTQQYNPDLADAVLAVGDVDIVDILKRASALAEFRLTPNFETVYNALNRVLRILPDDEPDEERGNLFDRLQNVIDKSALGIIDPSLFQVEAEKVLYACVVKARPYFERSIETRAYLDLLKQLRSYSPQ